MSLGTFVLVILNYAYVSLYVNVHVNTGALRGWRWLSDPPWTWHHNWLWATCCRCWGLNLGSLEDREELLSTEPALQPLETFHFHIEGRLKAREMDICIKFRKCRAVLKMNLQPIHSVFRGQNLEWWVMLSSSLVELFIYFIGVCVCVYVSE